GARAVGSDAPREPSDALKEWKSRRAELTMRAPVTGKHALFLENSRAGGDVDLSLFPAPLWHKQDGGPYIGSGSIVVMRDPDNGWVNAPIYPLPVHGHRKGTRRLENEGP